MLKPYVRYRLYTEDTRFTMERDNEFVKWVSTRFPRGSSMFTCDGVWYGGSEMGLCIEVITDEHTDEDMEAIAVDLRDFNDQEVVLLTREEINAVFV